MKKQILALLCIFLINGVAIADGTQTSDVQLRLNALNTEVLAKGTQNQESIESYYVENCPSLFVFLRQTSGQGYAIAQYFLAGCYWYGAGVPKDQEQATNWFEKSAEQGYAPAQNSLGVVYSQGIAIPNRYENGVETNKTKEQVAVEWYRKAAEQSYAKAQYNLGVMYQNGTGVAKDDTQAVDWFRKAAEQGYAEAQNNLGAMYAKGTGIAKDETQAVTWYRKAAEQGLAVAQNNLGVMYQDIKNNVQAVAWYRKAAAQGYAQSQDNLGVMYLNGKGVTQNEKLAIEWFRKAADQGFAQSQYNLGVMYLNGKGITKNKKLAIEWFRKAAEQGFASAKNALTLIEPQKREGANGYVAIISCGMSENSKVVPIACFLHSDLKITQGNRSKVYTRNSLYEAGKQDIDGIHVELPKHFKLVAQNSSDYSLVLSIKIVNPKGDVVFEDQAGSWGVISIQN